MKLKLVHNPKYASFLERCVATLIDDLLGSLLFVFVFFVLSSSVTSENFIVKIVYLLAYGFFPLIFISVFHIVYGTSKFGMTIGKYLVGIEVADKSRKLLSIKKVFFRSFIAKTVNASTLGLSYLAMLFDENHQCWHDQMSSAYVYKTNKNGLLVAILVLVSLLITIIFLGFKSFENVMSVVEYFR